MNSNNQTKSQSRTFPFSPEFLTAIGDFEAQFDHNLAAFSTWKCGGPADILVISKSAETLEKLVILAIENDVPYTILGHASNVLISDNGIRGLVIINKSRNIEIKSENQKSQDELKFPFEKGVDAQADGVFIKQNQFKNSSSKINLIFDLYGVVLQDNLLDSVNLKVANFIEKNKEKYNFYYLSNITEEQFENFQKLEIYSHFLGGIASFQSDFEKPQAEIFHELLEKFDLKPEECIFIDDSDRNVETAEKLGINGIIYSYHTDLERETFKIEEKIKSEKNKFLYFTKELEKKSKNENIIADKFTRQLIFRDNKKREHIILEFTIDKKITPKTPFREVYIENIDDSAIEFTLFVFENNQISQKIKSEEIKYISLHKSSEVNIHLKNKLKKIVIKTESGNLGSEADKRQPKMSFVVPYSLIFQKLGLQDNDWADLVINPADNFTISIQEVSKNFQDDSLYSENITLIETSDAEKLVCFIESSNLLKTYEINQDKSVSIKEYSQMIREYNPNTLITELTKICKENIERDLLDVKLTDHELETIFSTYTNFQFGSLGYDKNKTEFATADKSLILIPFQINQPNPEKEISQNAQEYDIYITPRHSETGDPNFYSFADLDYAETGIDENNQEIPLEKSEVVFDSGVDLSYSIAWSLQNGLTGLQWFAGIPGTMGGALYNNIHGGTRHFSDNFVSCKVLIPIEDLE